MKVLFLDIDGVLNDHKAHANGYCGIEPHMAAELNRILAACPDVKIVVSSAWRYCVHNGNSTVEGLEHLLLTHGVDCRKRLVGVTDPDPETFKPDDHVAPFDSDYWKSRGLLWRVDQIRAWVDSHEAEAFVVLDDLPLKMPELVQTVGEDSDGLTADSAAEVIRRFLGS